MKRTLAAPLALTAVLLASAGGTGAFAQEDWQSAYKLGDPVELKITDGIWQSCVVSENPPGGTMRVMCEEINIRGTYQRGAGRYIVYGQSDLRRRAIAATAPPAGGPAAAGPAPATPAAVNRPAPGTPTAANRPVPAAPAPARKGAKTVGGAAPGQVAAGAGAGSGGGALRVGEYACYGHGGQILAGMAFQVLPGGRYTDLDGTSSGTYRVEGQTVVFRGGHLDGTVGRGLRGGNFEVGAGAPCEPF